MADISILSRLVNGFQRNVDLSQNSLIVGSLKVGLSSPTELTKAILDKLILVNSVTDANGTFDTRYTKIADLASTTVGKGASLIGLQDSGSYFTTKTVEAALQQLGNVVGTGSASNISYTPNTGLVGTNVQTALDGIGTRLGTTETIANAAIPLAQKGAVNGVASLDSGGKVPVSQLPNSILEYQGTYNVSTNVPTLADFASGSAAGTSIGDVYKVIVGGTRNFGSGNITFIVGDYVICNSSGKWELAHSGSDAVVSVNGQSGVVVLTSDNVSEGTTNLYFSNTRAQTAVVIDSIAASDLTHAPSRNAVFNALALKQAASANLDEADVFFGVSNLTGAQSNTLSDGSNSDALHSHSLLKTTAAAGETFAATTLFAVRYAKAADAGFVAGRVYKADIDASTSDNFHVVGLVRQASLTSAGTALSFTGVGLMTSTAHGFTVGLPIYLSTSGVLVQTPPSTANQAVVKVGMAVDANVINIQIQIIGVN